MIQMGKLKRVESSTVIGVIFKLFYTTISFIDCNVKLINSGCAAKLARFIRRGRICSTSRTLKVACSDCDHGARFEV